MYRRGSVMRRLAIVAVLCVGCAFVWPVTARGQFGGGGWPRPGADPQLTGWQKSERRISRDDAKNLKLLWKLKLSSDSSEKIVPTEAIFGGVVITEKGFKDTAIVMGPSNTLYSVDYELGRIIWQRHFDVQSGPAQGMACQNARTAAALIQPQPVFGRGSPPPSPFAREDTTSPRRIGRGVGFAFRGVYVLTRDGSLHEQILSNGEDYAPAVKFLPSANGNLSDLTIIGSTLYVNTSHGCGGVPNGVWALDMSTPEYKVNSYSTNGISVSGLDGPAQSTDGKTLYAITGSGTPNSTSGVYPNGVIAVDPQTMNANDYFRPISIGATARADSDVSPLVFAYKGRDLVAAYLAGGRLVLLDSTSLGGANHGTPLYQTDPIAKNGGSGAWGRLASFEDKDGIRWILVSVRGPLASGNRFATTNGATPNGSVVAFKVEEQNDQTVLTPEWVSPDVTNPSPAAIAGGLVFTLANGESKKSPAKLYVLDATTGAPIYSSGNEITSSANFASISMSGGNVLFVTADSTLYSFGIGIEH